MSTPKFTILLPTSIDRGLLLPYSVGSIQKQTNQDYELFIVGDGVNDFTRGVIHELQSKDGRIQFFDYPKHPRRGEENRHEVLQQAKGRYVAYITDRDYWLPHHLDTLENYLQTYDFASTLNYHVKEDYLIFGMDGKLNTPPVCLLSCVGHTLEMYRRLPFGWRTTPPNQFTDVYMCEQFLNVEGCNYYSGKDPTILWFKRGHHPGLSSSERKELMIQWIKIMQDKALFQLKKDNALHALIRDYESDIKFARNQLILIKGRIPSKVPVEIWKKIKNLL